MISWLSIGVPRRSLFWTFSTEAIEGWLGLLVVGPRNTSNSNTREVFSVK